MTDFLEFDEYIRQGEPNQQERAAIWRTAIGLQAVDGLQTSDYLKQTAKKHIEGEIDIDEARQLIKTYYQSKATREVINDDQCEADKVSANITKILSSISLDFSAKGFVALHRRIFDGVLKHAPSVEWEEQANLGEKQSSEPQNEPQNEPQKFTPLSTRQQQILSLLSKDNSLSKQRLADALGLSMSTVKRELSTMSHVVKYVGPTKGGHWEIN